MDGVLAASFRASNVLRRCVIVICADTTFQSSPERTYTSMYRLVPGLPLFAVHDPKARTIATSPKNRTSTSERERRLAA
jgi:hypothetical protein